MLSNLLHVHTLCDTCGTVFVQNEWVQEESGQYPEGDNWTISNIHNDRLPLSIVQIDI